MAARKTPSNGSKPDKILRDALMIALHREDKDPDTGKKTKRLHKIADQLSRQAAEGDIPAIKEVFDRIEGRPAQAITGADGGALQMVPILNVVVEAKP